MNDRELNRLLKSTRTPMAAAAFRDELAQRVSVAIRQKRQFPARSIVESRGFDLRAWALGGAVVAVVMLVAFLFGRNRPTPESTVAFARAEKCIREVEAMFPNQVQSIVFDASGSRMVLSEQADVPDSVPVYLKFCGPHGCQEIVTFSGQQVRVNGDLCDVLTDAAGNVILAGKQLVWSSRSPAAGAGSYKIEARMMEASS